MKKIIKWGILGTGGIAHKFAEGLQHVSNARIVAVGSRNISKAKEFASSYNIEKAFGSYEDLAISEDIDIVYIATPHVFHCSNTLLCLNNNKAVLCEKPFAMNENEVQQMINKARQKNLFLMEALWSRFLPAIIKTKELVDSDAIGKIVHIKSDFGFISEYDLNSRLFNKALGGGSLLDIGIYPVFIALYLLGEPKKIDSSAVLSESGIDESIAINFTYASGAIASLYSTLMANTAVETEIYGTTGSIKLPRMWFFTNTVLWSSLDGKTETFTFDYPSMGYEFEAREVTNCLLEGKTESELLTLDFSLKLIKLLDYIREMNKIQY